MVVKMKSEEAEQLTLTIYNQSITLFLDNMIQHLNQEQTFETVSIHHWLFEWRKVDMLWVGLYSSTNMPQRCWLYKLFKHTMMFEFKKTCLFN